MTHRCAAKDCEIQVDDVHVLCGRHADKATYSLHLALMAAQRNCAGIKGESARIIFDKRLAEAQLKINEQEQVQI